MTKICSINSSSIGPFNSQKFDSLRFPISLCLSNTESSWLNRCTLYLKLRVAIDRHSERPSRDLCGRHRQAAIRARSRLSMAASPYAHVAAGHDISRPFTMKTPPADRRAPYHPRTLRGASMQQVRAQVPSCKEFRKTI